MNKARFDFENMNVLEFHDADTAPGETGWRRIVCTSSGNHPYANAWWPDGHLIRYEHTFTNRFADVLCTLAGEMPALPIPDFEDAYQTQRVREAALLAAKERRAVRLSDVH